MAPATLAALSLPCAARAQSVCPVDGGAVLPPSYGTNTGVFPADSAVGVPRDGFVRATYDGRVPSPPTLFVTRHATGARVPGSLAVIGAELQFHADAPLDANTQYDVALSDPIQGDVRSTFTTGSRVTTQRPPAFDGLLGRDEDGVTFVRSGPGDLCGDRNAVEVTVRFRRARDDDWPEGDIEYVVYETRGPHIAGPVERARVRGLMAGTSCATAPDVLCAPFRLASENAGEQVCFNVQAVDPYGRADGNAVERCTDPEVGNVFRGCAARPASREDGWSRWFVAGALLAWSLRRSRVST